MNKYYLKIKRRAFTLIEVIIALVVVSIALLGLIRLHIISINTNTTSQAKAQAVFLAQEKIAEITANGFPDPGIESGLVEKNALSYEWKIEVADMHMPRFEQVNNSQLREISVVINWKQGTRQRKLHMSTCVADRKLQ